MYVCTMQKLFRGSRVTLRTFQKLKMRKISSRFNKPGEVGKREKPEFSGMNIFSVCF
jgi:hypothetical protein